MKKTYSTIILIAICLTLLMYPRTYTKLLEGLKNTFVFLRLGNFSHSGSPANSVDKTMTQVVFMFDDGWASVYTAYTLLKDYGYKGSIAVIPDLISEIEYLSYAQLAELYMEGWDILNHSYSHQEGMYFNCDEMLSEYIRAREWLERHFFLRGINNIITPYGECNPYLIPLLIKNGFQSIRTSDNVLLLNRDEVTYYKVKTIHLLTNVSVETVTAELTDYAGGDFAILFNLHKIGEGPDSTQMTFSYRKLKAITEYLHANEDTFQVVSYSSLFK